MADGDKIIDVPNLGRIAFPGTMNDDDIHKAISDHVASISKPGAMQAKPGGPVFTAPGTPQAQQPEPSFWEEYKGKLRDAALAAGQTIVPNATTDPMQNLKNVGTALNEQVNKAATTPWGQGGPVYGTLAMLGNALMNTLHGAASGVQTMGQGVINRDPNAVATGGGQAAGNLLQLGVGEKAPEALSNPLMSRDTLQNVMNEGTRKAAFIQRQVETANAVKQHIVPAMDALHNDGKAIMSDVSTHIDSVKPEGAFSRADVANTLKDATSVIKDDSKVPTFLKREMDIDQPKTKTGKLAGGQALDLSDPQQLKFYNQLKAQGALTPEQIKATEGGALSGERMSFEQLKQLHSDIGTHMASAEGAPEAGIKAAYAKTGEMLRKEAESHGLLDQWQEGVGKVRVFNNMMRSPLKDVYYGQNHGQIMRPLVSDETGPQVGPMLEAISPYGIDMDKLGNTIGKYKYGQTWDRMSEPTKLTLFMAAFSPKLAAIRTGLPQALRSDYMTQYMHPGALEGVATEKPQTLTPSAKIKAKQVSIRNQL